MLHLFQKLTPVCTRSKTCWIFSFASQTSKPCNFFGFGRSFTSSLEPNANNEPSLKLIRNVGIIAHIDAGKTTTTERMLYYAHRTHHLGEVDRGDTVTDYLPEERERGITIVSSLACLNWHQHTIHLLDTPGHVDFTMEVERSMAVLDGVVTILDASKGVQAQTRTVCRQADRHELPRLIFVNKMDRPTASLDLCLASLKAHLPGKARYVAIHYPIYSRDIITNSGRNSEPNAKINSVAESNKVSNFVGLVDLVSMDFKNWATCRDVDDPYRVYNLVGNSSPNQSASILSAQTMKSIWEARSHLASNLAELDEEFADQFLQLDKPELLIDSATFQKALIQSVHSFRLIPILIGSSRHNIGIQPLLDAIVNYVPDPSIRPVPSSVSRFLQTHGSELIGKQSSSPIHPSTPKQAHNTKLQSDKPKLQHPVMLVFKVCFVPHRGPLSLVRVYSGVVMAGTMITNWSPCRTGLISEKILGVFRLTGDHLEAIDSAGPGSIVALTGLQSTHTGDLLGPQFMTSSPTSDAVPLEDQWTSGDPEISISEPVIYAALEPGSRSEVRALEHALSCVQREDPSFKAKFDSETGQWIVGGMGDLHLEIIMSRLKREYKLGARLGSLSIAYKECPNPSSSVTSGLGRMSSSIDGRDRTILVEVLMEPIQTKYGGKKSQITIDRSVLNSLEEPLSSRLHHIIKRSCLDALESSGPLLRSPIVGVNLHVNHLFYGRPDQIPTSLDQIHTVSSSKPPNLSSPSYAAFSSLLKATMIASIRDAVMKITDWHLMEPMMQIELNIPNDESKSASISEFIGDLTSRRAEIQSVDCSDFTTDSIANPIEAKYHSITAVAPLSELMNYSSTVRTLSSGRAELHLKLADYHPVSAEHQLNLLNKMRWIPRASGDQ